MAETASTRRSVVPQEDDLDRMLDQAEATASAPDFRTSVFLSAKNKPAAAAPVAPPALSPSSSSRDHFIPQRERSKTIGQLEDILAGAFPLTLLTCA